jgi:hypothetical protein
MKFVIKIFGVVIGLVVVVFIASVVPQSADRGSVFEKSTVDIGLCSQLEAHLASWNGQQYYSENEPDQKYLDGLKQRFIESGISEDYYNRNISLIYANKVGEQINAWYLLKTNSWLDTYNLNSGDSFPICNNTGKVGCGICKQYVTRIHGWVNLNYGDAKSTTVYSIQGKIWHDDKVVGNDNDVSFNEVKSILSPLKAGLISKSCVPISLNRYSIYLSPRMTFEYVVNGENLSTMFDSQKHMQARVDLATGDVSCTVQASFIN